MKTKFIIALVIQGLIIAFLVVYALYQQTEAKRQEAIAVDLAAQAQTLETRLQEVKAIAEKSMEEAQRQRKMCEELYPSSLKNK